MSANSPFNWKGQPSILADDKNFVPTRSGRTQAQASSQTASRNVKEVTERTGRNPGTIPSVRRAERLANDAVPAYRYRTGAK